MPLQEQIDEWKKTAVHLDKDHTHGMLMYNSLSNICIISVLDILFSKLSVL